MASTVIFHPHHGFALCYATSYEEAPPGLTHPEHGRLVSCGLCGRYGVIPDQGYELEFLPDGTERAPGRRVRPAAGQIEAGVTGGESDARFYLHASLTGDRARMPCRCSGNQSIAARLHPHG